MKIVFANILVLQILFIEQIYGWKIFNKGRLVGGNLQLHSADSSNKSEFIKEAWFTQILDHFNPTDTRTWQQRYFVNSQYFNSSYNSPIFLTIGGEGEADIKWMSQGSWIDYAQRFGALCFQVEHRYYGKSHPTKNLSTKNLQYLSSHQALADLANFISEMNAQYGFTYKNQWIVFGGSYSGSLAAWMRMKYPYLVHGAVSASGPLLAKVDFSEFLRVVEESLSTYSDECVDQIKTGTSQIDILLRHRLGQLDINNKFKLCDPIEKSMDNNNDLSNFYATLSDNFAGIVQYNKDNREGKASNITIDTVCKIMLDDKLGSAVNRLATVNKLILQAYDQKCLDYKYDQMIQTNTNTSWFSEVAEGGRQWTYQTCTEFGFFQSSSHAPQIFGNSFPVEFYVQQCADIFGPKFNATFIYKAVENTNNLYGALDIQVTNVVFVQGSIDPWHALGITKTLIQGAPAIYIKGTAHCANLYPSSVHDLPELKAAREQVAEYIDSWIRL